MSPTISTSIPSGPGCTMIFSISVLRIGTASSRMPGS
jgi:hypothetical protein